MAKAFLRWGRCLVSGLLRVRHEAWEKDGGVVVEGSDGVQRVWQRDRENVGPVGAHCCICATAKEHPTIGWAPHPNLCDHRWICAPCMDQLQVLDPFVQQNDEVLLDA